MLVILLLIFGALIGLFIRGNFIIQADDGWNDGIFKGQAMRTNGMSRANLLAIASAMDCQLVGLKEQGYHRWSFSLKPNSSDGDFARRAPSGRKGTWTCYHGFKEFILAGFAGGITSVRTSGPRGKGVTYRDEKQFRKDLPKFADREVGEDITFIELCDHAGEV